MLVEATIVQHRRQIAPVWYGIAGCVLVTGVTSEAIVAAVTWLVTLVLLVVTARLHHPQPEEQLVRARAYRGMAGAVLAISLLGVVVGLLPGASEKGQQLAAFFGGLGVFAYYALVARGPNPAMILATLASFGWFPAALALINTCKCGMHEANWLEQASHVLFVVELVLIAGLVAVALIAFQRRTSELPDARVL